MVHLCAGMSSQGHSLPAPLTSASTRGACPTGQSDRPMGLSFWACPWHPKPSPAECQRPIACAAHLQRATSQQPKASLSSGTSNSSRGCYSLLVSQVSLTTQRVVRCNKVAASQPRGVCRRDGVQQRGLLCRRARGAAVDAQPLRPPLRPVRLAQRPRLPQPWCVPCTWAHAAVLPALRSLRCVLHVVLPALRSLHCVLCLGLRCGALRCILRAGTPLQSSPTAK